MKKLYAIFWGSFDSNGGLWSVYDKKKDAIRDIRNVGYKHNKEQDLFLNYEEESWFRIAPVDYNVLNYWRNGKKTKEKRRNTKNRTF